MGKTKTIEVSIRSLRTTYTPEDKWLETHHKVFGAGIDHHPAYLSLKGNDDELKLWFASMDNPDWKGYSKALIDLVKDIKKNGVLEHIKIYRDGRINTGHKRSAVCLFLGIDLIRAEVVPDDYKL